MVAQTEVDRASALRFARNGVHVLKNYARQIWAHKLWTIFWICSAEGHEFFEVVPLVGVLRSRRTQDRNIRRNASGDSVHGRSVSGVPALRLRTAGGAGSRAGDSGPGKTQMGIEGNRSRIELPPAAAAGFPASMPLLVNLSKEVRMSKGILGVFLGWPSLPAPLLAQKRDGDPAAHTVLFLTRSVSGLRNPGFGWQWIRDAGGGLVRSRTSRPN